MQPMNRRTFIGSSLAATLSAAASPPWAAAPLNAGFAKANPQNPTHQIDRIGLQLYTVRAAMGADLEGTIAKVAATGYKEVEFAGYFDHSPKDIRATLDENGLASPSCHVTYHFVEKHWDETLEAAKIVGHSYIICPWIDEKQRAEPGGWKRAAELFNKAGEASQKEGIQFGYHNHSFEFHPTESLGGKLPYDFLLAETDPKFVVMEMDLCWITVAGKDPVAYFNNYPGRFPLVHVKDYVNDPHSTSSYSGATGSVKFAGHLADVGQGTINWKNLFAHAEKAGIKHCFVENDDPKNAFEDIKISYNYLHDLRF
ncbi:MAG: sugar phosphate isomerase/epimerase [Acidobacteria bacterium]|nr:MAG: sugar phosphate isomerase/epimerase [Acidobacteriota bacterium]